MINSINKFNPLDKKNDFAIIVNGLVKKYKIRKNLFNYETITVLNNISFYLKKGKALAIVGESGCGKSTLARQLSMIEKPTSGNIIINNTNICSRKKNTNNLQIKVQMIFQNILASLNPRKTIKQILLEPLLINSSMNKEKCFEKVVDIINLIGLRFEYLKYYPYMLSGGERQRISIGRSIILDPSIIIADEPISALDVSMQAQIISLFIKIQKKFKISYVLISHDIAAISYIADVIMVMYSGNIIEMGNKNIILNHAIHPYTKALISSIPSILKQNKKFKIKLKEEENSSIINYTKGCIFYKRCIYSTHKCQIKTPYLRLINSRRVSCHYAEKISKLNFKKNTLFTNKK